MKMISLKVVKKSVILSMIMQLVNSILSQKNPLVLNLIYFLYIRDLVGATFKKNDKWKLSLPGPSFVL